MTSENFSSREEKMGEKEKSERKSRLFFSFLNMLLRLYQTGMSLPVAHETGDIGVFSFFFAGSSSISYSCCTLLAASTFMSWLADRQVEPQNGKRRRSRTHRTE